MEMETALVVKNVCNCIIAFWPVVRSAGPLNDRHRRAVSHGNHNGTRIFSFWTGGSRAALPVLQQASQCLCKTNVFDL